MTTLTDRYVAAVVGLIPNDQAADTETELRAAIDDAVEGRVDAGEDRDSAERAVLTELGDPARLAAEYADRPLWLLGPPYYLAWRQTMRTLLAIIPAIAAVVPTVIRLATGEGVLDAVFGGLWIAIIAALNVALWTTVGFVIAERSGDSTIADMEPFLWTVDRLPQGTSTTSTFTRLATFFAVAINLVLIGMVWSVSAIAYDGTRILEADAWRIAAPVLIGLLAVSIVLRLLRYRTGRWTTPLATATGVLNAGFAGWWWWALWNLRLLDPAFVARINDELWPGSETWLLVSARVVALVVLAVYAWDTISAFVAAERARRR